MNADWERLFYWRPLPYLHFPAEHLLRIIKIEVRDALEFLAKSGLTR